MFLFSLLLLPIIYVAIMCLLVRSGVRHYILNDVTSCAHPLCYPFKVKYLTHSYFLEDNKGVILFHPKPLDTLPSCKELEDTLNYDDILKLAYAKHNMTTDMMAHNYLTFIKSLRSPFY